jgi:hypothetical protein
MNARRNGAGLAAARTANEPRKIVGNGKRDRQSSKPPSPKPQSAIRAEYTHDQLQARGHQANLRTIDVAELLKVTEGMP